MIGPYQNFSKAKQQLHVVLIQMGSIQRAYFDTDFCMVSVIENALPMLLLTKEGRKEGQSTKTHFPLYWANGSSGKASFWQENTPSEIVPSPCLALIQIEMRHIYSLTFKMLGTFIHRYPNFWSVLALSLHSSQKKNHVDCNCIHFPPLLLRFQC